MRISLFRRIGENRRKTEILEKKTESERRMERNGNKKIIGKAKEN